MSTLAPLETSVLGPRRPDLAAGWRLESAGTRKAREDSACPTRPPRSPLSSANTRSSGPGAGARGVTKPSRNAGAGAEAEGARGEPTSGPPWRNGRRASPSSRPASPTPATRAAGPRRLGRRKASWESRLAPEGRAGARRQRGYKREGAGGGRKWAVQLLPALLLVFALLEGRSVVGRRCRPQ